jgi:hypothetical protein
MLSRTKLFLLAEAVAIQHRVPPSNMYLHSMSPWSCRPSRSFLCTPMWCTSNCVAISVFSNIVDYFCSLAKLLSMSKTNLPQCHQSKWLHHHFQPGLNRLGIVPWAKAYWVRVWRRLGRGISTSEVSSEFILMSICWTAYRGVIHSPVCKIRNQQVPILVLKDARCTVAFSMLHTLYFHLGLQFVGVFWMCLEQL